MECQIGGCVWGGACCMELGVTGTDHEYCSCLFFRAHDRIVLFLHPVFKGGLWLAWTNVTSEQK